MLFISGAANNQATGGTVYQVGDYQYHLFTTSGNFRFTAKGLPNEYISYLVISGGSGGSPGAFEDSSGSTCGGAGGNGGGNSFSNCVATFTDNQQVNGYPLNTDYSIVIGAGGPANGGDGNVSTCDTPSWTLYSNDGGGVTNGVPGTGGNQGCGTEDGYYGGGGYAVTVTGFSDIGWGSVAGGGGGGGGGSGDDSTGSGGQGGGAIAGSGGGGNGGSKSENGSAGYNGEAGYGGSGGGGGGNGWSGSYAGDGGSGGAGGVLIKFKYK